MKVSKTDLGSPLCVRFSNKQIYSVVIESHVEDGFEEVHDPEKAKTHKCPNCNHEFSDVVKDEEDMCYNHIIQWDWRLLHTEIGEAIPGGGIGPFSFDEELPVHWWNIQLVTHHTEKETVLTYENGQKLSTWFICIEGEWERRA
jgi:hypothetical protein